MECSLGYESECDVGVFEDGGEPEAVEGRIPTQRGDWS